MRVWPGILLTLAAAPFVATPGALGWVHRFVLAAILIGVPLAWHALRAPDGAWRGIEAWTMRLWLPAAAAVAVGAVLKPGAVAAALVVPWLLLAAARAATGLVRIVAADRLRTDVLAVGLADLFLPIGAFWLIVAHAGATVAGFGPTIAMLTAVHFHYTAYLALILIALASRAVGDRPTLRFAALAAALGTLVTATGITMAEWGQAAGLWVGVVGASAVVAAFVALAAWTLVSAHAIQHKARWVLVASAAAGLFGVPWGLAWAIDQAAGGLGLTIAAMVRLHGAINAGLFVLPAIAAWAVIRPAVPGWSIQVSLGRLRTGPAGTGTPEPLSVHPGHWDLPLADERDPHTVRDAAFDAARERLRRFDVGVPGRLLIAPRGPVRVGDVVVQAARVGPFVVQAPVRIESIEDTADRFAITCRTVGGHAEAGVKTYAVHHDGAVMLSLDSRSGPATWFMRLWFRHVRRLQDDVNRAAMEAIKRHVAAAASQGTPPPRTPYQGPPSRAP